MLRTPLATISSNHRRNTEWSPYTRGLIVGAVFSGLTSAEIEKQCNVEESTVRYSVKQASSRPNGVFKPRSGRPKSISLRDQRLLVSPFSPTYMRFAYR